MAATRKRFAEGTEVAVEKTRAELDRLLAAHGATQRAVYLDDETRRARVQFSIEGRMVRLDLRVDVSDVPLPGVNDYNQRAPRKCPHGWNTWTTERQRAWVAERVAQRERESWRRLLLVTKAKLEIVADGASTVGGTVYDRLARCWGMGRERPLQVLRRRDPLGRDGLGQAHAV